MKMVWFRVYSEVKDDPKMLSLTDHQFRIWIGLLCMVSESGRRGTLAVVPRRGLAAALHTTPDALEEALAVFTELDMVICAEDGAITAVHFLDRQYDKPSDRPEATAERKQQQRARAQIAPDPPPPAPVPPANSDVTPVSRASHATYVDPEEDPEREIIPPTPQAVSAPPQAAANAATGKPAKPRATRATPKPSAAFDWPGLWQLITAQQGYKPTWNYQRETEAVKRLLTAHPSAQPADFARFLAYVGTCWPFCEEPTRQPTFTEGAKHFGAWFTQGRPASAAPPNTRQEVSHAPVSRAEQQAANLADIAAARLARNGRSDPGERDRGSLALHPRLCAPADSGRGHLAAQTDRVG